MEKRLPEDLMVEILLRLPVKSLMRFRCVCKSWFHLIKSSNFINMHLKHHSAKNDERVQVVCCLEDETTVMISFHSYESLNSIISPRLQIPHLNYVYVDYTGPCDGLICLSDYETIVLCNPSMREFKVLPPCSFPFPEGVESVGKTIGLGFDSSTNDYKVVTIHHLDRRNGYPPIDKVNIYNLSTNSWREIDHDMPCIDCDPGYGTLFNGAFHWIANAKDNDFILSFDMITEVFRYLELPYLVPEKAKQKRLTVLHESLSLFATEWYPPEQQFIDIWVMNQYSVADSWTKQFIIGPLSGAWCPFLLWKNEVILIEGRERRLVSCALDTHEMNEFEINAIWDTLGVMVYQESLISIK